MRKIREIHIFVIIVFLMLVRADILKVTTSTTWVGSIVVIGVVIAVYDIARKIIEHYADINDKVVNQIGVLIAVFLLNIIVGIGIIIALWNFLKPLGFLNNAKVLDELTLIALLLSLSQHTVIRSIIYLIDSGK